jgi:hypothetical protein
MSYHFDRLKKMCDGVARTNPVVIQILTPMIEDEIAIHMSKLTDAEVEHWNESQKVYINDSGKHRDIDILDTNISCTIS